MAQYPERFSDEVPLRGGARLAALLRAEDDIAIRINTVNLKNRLRDIETNCRNRLHAWLLRIVGALPANRGIRGSSQERLQGGELGGGPSRIRFELAPGRWD